MILDLVSVEHPVRTGVLLLLFGTLFYLLRNKYGNGLNRVPGPWLAGFTDLWRLFLVRRHNSQEEHIKLHEKYGPIVRIGPRAVSFSDPEAVKTVYSASSGYHKSSFYPVQQVLAKGNRLETMFNTANEQYHAKLRRSVSSAYAMSTLINFEPFVDSTSTEFLKQLKKRFANRQGDDGICDFGAWLQYYAFDVIGELTYSKRLGFVETGADVDHIIRDLESFLDYVVWVGQMPFLDRFLVKNPIKIWMARNGLLKTSSPVAEFARKHINERQINEKADPESQAPKTQRRDFLNRFREARVKDPDFISEQLVLALTVANMFAGSDTTGITMRAVFYYLLKNPSKMEKLMDEIREQEQNGGFTREDALVRWDDVRELPYLSAVINEALRCHPAVGLTLERIVPRDGITISGHYMRPGTIVGCSAWVLHRNTDIFGADASEFRPERWIEATPEQRRKMGNFLFSFGAGARTCIGKNISLLELYKLVPAVLRTFELELVHPDQPWKLHNSWFVRQRGFEIRIKDRKTGEGKATVL